MTHDDLAPHRGQANIGINYAQLYWHIHASLDHNAWVPAGCQTTSWTNADFFPQDLSSLNYTHNEHKLDPNLCVFKQTGLWPLNLPSPNRKQTDSLMYHEQSKVGLMQYVWPALSDILMGSTLGDTYPCLAMSEMCWWIIPLQGLLSQGLYSLSGKSAHYPQISWSLEAARLDVIWSHRPEIWQASRQRKV